MSLVLLFVYGQLKPEYSPPKSMMLKIPDSVSGDLYQRGTGASADAAAINLGKSKRKIKGYLLAIKEEELNKLDKLEAPEYKKRQVRLNSGVKAWVYEYLKEPSEDMQLIKSGIYREDTHQAGK